MGSSACAIPHGSFARPVAAPGNGASLVSAGATVPLAVAASTNLSEDSDVAATVEEALIIPAAAYDYSFGQHSMIGVEVSLLHSGLTTANTSGDGAFGVFVNPRFEHGVAKNFSIGVDVNIGVLGVEDSSTVFFAPHFFVRGYVPIATGGIVLTQALSTAVITVSLPGSIAYDIAIPIGESSKMHIFPELRWDPTLFFIGDTNGGLVTLSGGLTLMFEIGGSGPMLN